MALSKLAKAAACVPTESTIGMIKTASAEA
jgi:hypothetical protein